MRIKIMAKIVTDSALIANIIEISFGVALSLEQTTVTTEHILFGILQTNILHRYFIANGIEVDKMSKEILAKIQENSHLLKNLMPSDDPAIMTGQLTNEVTTLIESIQKYAKAENRAVDIADFLLGLLNLRDTYSSYFMNKYGITSDMILEIRKGFLMATEIMGAMSQNAHHHMGGSTGSALNEYCENLNEKVKTTVSDTLIGRSKEIFTIAHTLAKRKKCNALLIGDPGTGKTAIVEGLAQRINAGDVPETLKNKIIYSLDVGTLVSGSKYRGDYEEKITGILNELVSRPETILFIDEAHLMDTGDGKGQMGLGLSSMIKPHLSRGNIKVIASTTWEGFRQTFEKDTALMRRFRTIAIDEPSKEETIAILKGSRDSVEKFHSVKIENSALEAAVELTIKYQPEKRLPDKAIDILDSACARKKVVVDETNVIDRVSIIREITEMTGIKIKSETTNEKDSKIILSLSERLKNVVFHQDKAVERIAQSLIISQAGLKNPKKPIGSFLFVGPSGVGKTYLAQQLANDMDMHFFRYNMSEFQEKHAVARLIGAPPGYIGFSNGGTGEGQLVNDLLKHPNSVVLFDEVEKAHPDTFNVFLQLLDDGELTGTTGKIANAKNCIIIMTSNLGTKEGSKEAFGFNSEKTGKSASSKAVDDFFLTELRGRMTGIVEFSKLDDLSYRKIVTERINDISKMISSKNIRIVPSEALITYILDLNNSSIYGARKIAGIIEDLVNYPLSIKLLEGTIKSNSTINLDWVKDKLVIEQVKTKVSLKETIKQNITKEGN
jgi:ATP-dependent Clp protease ATP-binding subunit ClpA